MSYAYPSAMAAAGLPSSGTDPVLYLKSTWVRFRDMFPELLALQHRAASLAATLPPSREKEEARASVDEIALLIRVQARTAKRIEESRGFIGLGAVIIPPAILAGLVALALIVAWVFRSYAAQAKILDMIEAGTLTPSEALELMDAAGPMPDMSVLGGLGIGTVLGAAAVFGILWYMQRGRRRSNPCLPPSENPQLMILGANPQPDGLWSRRVLSLDYVHDDDGEPYTHTFRGGVRMQALEDGSVRLFHPRRRIWRDL
ncbi:MAG TPA: hypothetical protein VM054_07435 [bacterium]|nr:hypothetical protein [bacterium]